MECSGNCGFAAGVRFAVSEGAAFDRAASGEPLDHARLLYIGARGDDHNDLSDAVGVERGSLMWCELLDLVRSRFPEAGAR